MLNAYIAATQNLLQNPSAPTSLYSTTALVTYINTARSQIASESACIRQLFSASTGVGAIAFSSISVSTVAGISSVLNVRMISSTVSGLLNTHAWEWFNLYYLNANPVQGLADPTDWCQYAPGTYGYILLRPAPASTVTLLFDCVCLPIPLVDDSTSEAIPYPWTDAVPFFAAFYALLSAQSPARNAEADKMFQRYELFAGRARQYSNPDVEGYQFAKAGPPIRNIPIDAGNAAQIASGKGG